MVVVQARHQKKPVKKTAKRASAESDTPTLWQRHERDIWIVVMVVVGLFALLAEAGALGPVGRQISRALALVFGAGRFVLPLVLLSLSVALIWGKIEVERARLSWGVALGMVSVCGLGHLFGGRPHINGGVKALAHAGGWIGVLIGGGLYRTVGMGGALTILLAVLVVAVIITTGIGLRALAGAVGTVLRAIASRFASWWTARPRREELDEQDDEPERIDLDEPPYEDEPEPFEYEEEFEQDEPAYEVEIPPPAPPRATPSRPRERRQMSGEWELPPLSMLVRTKDQKQDRSAIVEAGAQLVEALAAHGVDTTLVGYTVGPTVTRFELELGPGVKVSSVTSLNKDIAYAMASPDVRILAPIPGKSAIGVEVPNRTRQLVSLRDILESKESRPTATTHPLEVAMGRDIAGRAVMANLAEMPHILISGATGSGKSSCMNSIITSILMRDTPDQVKLILIDPKRVELGQYDGLPHLLNPVVVDPKKAANALSWAVKEMERRYDLLAENGVRDITGYNQLVEEGLITAPRSDRSRVRAVAAAALGEDHPAVDDEADLDEPEPPQTLPFILLVVDELNDLMMVAARDVEDSIVRIAQMARAVGIHLVIATQRPSVDVITGVIKANIPSRMAFSVSSLADSRVILDQPGAERLIGKGDMLLLTASSNIPRRLQAPWVSEEEVRGVVAHWQRQGGQTEAIVGIDNVDDGPSGGGGMDDDDDELLVQARDLVVRSQLGSTSMLQRKLRVGFARAGRLMDLLEQAGVVGPSEGSKARAVLMTPEELDGLNRR